jgi:hypothetical protein
VGDASTVTGRQSAVWFAGYVGGTGLMLAIGS